MKNFLKIVILSLVIAVLNIGSVEAGPDNTAKYLMNEPVSMMDWGCYRLEKWLAESLLPVARGRLSSEIEKTRILKSTFFVKYNYEANKIVIYRIDNDDFLPENQVIMPIKERARFWIKNVETFANKFTVAEFFSHNGFIRGKEQKELTSALENMVEIKVMKINVNDDDLETVCKTAMDSEEIFCSDLAQKEKEQKPPKFNFEPSKKKE